VRRFDFVTDKDYILNDTPCAPHTLSMVHHLELTFSRDDIRCAGTLKWSLPRIAPLKYQLLLCRDHLWTYNSQYKYSSNIDSLHLPPFSHTYPGPSSIPHSPTLSRSLLRMHLWLESVHDITGFCSTSSSSSSSQRVMNANAFRVSG